MSNPAETYEQEMVPALFARLAEPLVAIARPQVGERVLDVACGTGIVARRIALRVGPSGQVVGLDLSPAMLEVAAKAAEREGLAIEWHEGRAETLPFADESFDLVVCQFSLQFMPDRLAAVREMRRVLRRDRRLVTSIPQKLEQRPFDEQLNSLMEQRFGVGPFRQAFSPGDPEVLRATLTGAGLREVTITPVSIASRYADPERFVFVRIMTVVAAVPSLQQMTAEDADAMVNELRGPVMQLVQPYIQDGEVVLPIHQYIAHGRR